MSDYDYCYRCRFGCDSGRKYPQPDLDCRRFPSAVPVDAGYWCGEFSKKTISGHSQLQLADIIRYSPKATKILSDAGILTVSLLIHYGREELAKLGLKRDTLNEIRRNLRYFGFEMKS